MALDTVFREGEEENWRERVERIGPVAAGARSWPGCTAIAALICGDRLFVANAGKACLGFQGVVGA